MINDDNMVLTLVNQTFGMRSCRCTCASLVTFMHGLLKCAVDCDCSFLAWNWYPPVNEAAAKGPPRLHAHADMDIITLLYQRTGALPVISRSDLLLVLSA